MKPKCVTKEGYACMADGEFMLASEGKTLLYADRETLARRLAALGISDRKVVRVRVTVEQIPEDKP